MKLKSPLPLLAAVLGVALTGPPVWANHCGACGFLGDSCTPHRFCYAADPAPSLL